MNIKKEVEDQIHRIDAIVKQLLELNEKCIEDHTKLIYVGSLLERNKRSFFNPAEKRIEHYVEAFITGATVEKVDMHRTARNAPTHYKVQDLKYWCSEFMKEDFMLVQKPFWARYKESTKNLPPNFVPSKTIYNTIQSLKKNK